MKTVEELLREIENKIDARLAPFTEKMAQFENKLLDTKEHGDSKELPWVDVCERVSLITRAQVYRDPKAFAALQKADWLNTATGSEGGYLVPIEFSNQIFRLADDYGVARRDAFSVPMASATKKMPAGLTGVTMSYVEEGGKKPLTKGTFGIVELVARTACGISAMTKDVVDDSAPDLVAYLMRLIPESLAQREDTSLFFGNGGTILGIVNTTTPDSVVTVPASGATAEDVTLDDLNKMKYAIKGSAARGGKFYCNRTFMGVLERIKDSNGRYLVTTSPDGSVSRIWGHDIATTDAFPNAPTAGDVVAVFGNLQNAYHGQRKELAIMPSDEATLGVYNEQGTLTDIISAFGQNIRFIRFEVRHDFKPALGSAFVKLQLTTS